MARDLSSRSWKLSSKRSTSCTDVPILFRKSGTPRPLTTSFSASFLAANGGTADSAFAALIAGLDAGNAYFNIHTTAFPGGEIRGQLAAVPEPGTWMLLLGGFSLLGVVLRQRRRRPKEIWALRA